MLSTSYVLRNRSIQKGIAVLPLLFQPLLASPAAIPDGLRTAIESQSYTLQPAENGFNGANATQKFGLHFDRDSASIATGKSSVRLHLSAYGRETNSRASTPAAMQLSGNRLEYRRRNFTEWYVNRSNGLEQGFTFAERPAGFGRLAVKLDVDGALQPRGISGDTVLLDTVDGQTLRYAGLKVWDAQGRTLRADMRVKGSAIWLVADDTAAIYPVTIDPTLQQAKLTAPDGLAADDFGYAVAVNGSTAVVGAFGKSDFTGAAYVYVKSGTTWTEQAKLTASDGANFNNFGTTVAVSGSTVLVGAFENSGSIGAVYVFVGNGGVWTQQAKLTAANGQSSDEFGYAVSLDGNTAIIGALNANAYTGSAYVFTRSGTTWTQQTELFASNGAGFDSFGDSVAVKGTLALIGARSHASNGAAYVFVQNGGVWTQQAELLASDGALNDRFGSAVALDGTTALVGAYDNKSELGAAYVFVQSGTAWSQQAKLTATGGVAGDEFGYSVAVSGNAALVGAPFQGRATGSAYLFVRSGVVWAETKKLNAVDYAVSDQYGDAVALNGNTGVIGAPFKLESTGAAYVDYFPLASPTPAAGNPGSAITISGSGFVANEKVYVIWNAPRVYLATATADATGSFSGLAITVPATAAVGLNSFYAQGATAKDLATNYFTVQ